MDSMRSLNKSLPSTQANRMAPPEDLLPAFKQAALSVTNLYKSAANYHDSIRQAGYQDALDDLLKFLDKENLGLQDGEGWRVRQWATARYDVSHLQQSEGEEEDAGETEEEPRSASPEKSTQDDAQHTQSHPDRDTSSVRQSTTSQGQDSHALQQPIFHFSAGSDNTMQTDDPSQSDAKPSPVRLEVTNRSNRIAQRLNGRHNSRSITRPTSQTAGSKRKMPLPDFAEIFNVSFDRKDGFDGSGSGGGSSKRTRLV